MNFSVFIVTYFTWVLLTGYNDISELLVGFLVSLVISVVFKRYYRIKFDGWFLVKIVKFLLIYLPIFIWEMIKANFDVAARVLNPKLPINPGFVRVKTELKKDTSRLFLANSITLTPGTLTLDVEEDTLYIHWIDVKAKSADERRRHISEKFEKILKGVFE
ncbi:cation:proton antiporter [Thermosipho melanesiensis]|uniref:Cation antiporter n=2 Tax=Thermosipho melanesiensis TaxID=46541 RepID=A6LMB3_THEM4|nr:Na+/H+ antiporter subunit E [Thermosipho melanesiensis]ABR31064.1 cation antiporter [Thermosipho melanesiensis BI429]APT74158.1 cation:proton antiporter [Thermosipho melanesiensis]OOC36104.1 cation:proton antiporter [Thermosipho melanesiensis]OOC36921.1 cation:proton antiporter [Thermosipho melanesiensis]OOC37672.1 cation:proton antiporter [Thermosipho melanesiensis]